MYFENVLTHIWHIEHTSRDPRALCGTEQDYVGTYKTARHEYADTPTCDTCVLLAFAEPDTVQVCVQLSRNSCTCAFCREYDDRPVTFSTTNMGKYGT